MPLEADDIWVLTDGAAGNERQALALAQALAPGQPRVWRLDSRAPWRWAAPRRLPGAERMFGPEFAAAQTTPPRLAIGCGRQAALATRLLRAGGARAVQILDPRLDPAHWDAVVTPQHDGLTGPNVLAPLGSLHPIDADWLARARAQFPQFEHLPRPRTVLLLGGPVKNAPLDERWWRNTGGALEYWLERDGGSLLITGSRRTPPWLRAAARALCPEAPGVRWFADTDGINPYPGLLAWADRIVVSHDSVNLISEACATSAPVHIAHDFHLRGRHDRFVRSLEALGRVKRLHFRSEDWPVTPLVETARIAAELRQRLGL